MARSRNGKVKVCKADMVLELLEERVMFDASVDQDHQQDQSHDAIAVQDQSTQSVQATQSVQTTQPDTSHSADQSQVADRSATGDTPWVQQADGRWHREVGGNDEWRFQTGSQTYYFIYDSANQLWYKDADGSAATTSDRSAFGDPGTSGAFVYDGTWHELSPGYWYEYDGDTGYWWYEGQNQWSHNYSTGQWYDYGSGTWLAIGDAATSGHTFGYQTTWTDLGGTLQFQYDGNAYGKWDSNGDNNPEFRYNYHVKNWDLDLGSGWISFGGDNGAANQHFFFDGQEHSVGGGFYFLYDSSDHQGEWNGGVNWYLIYDYETGQWVKDVDGSAHADKVFTGHLNNIDADLGTLMYASTANYLGADAVNSVTDDGTTLLSASTPAMATLNVTSLNEAPVNTVPGSPITFEGSLHFNGNLSVLDSDAGTDPISVTLSASHGNLTLGSAPIELTITGDGSHSVILEGDQSLINSALNGLTYTPDSSAVIYAGTDAISVVTSDLGHNGTGGALTDTDPIDLNVNLRNVGGIDYWVVNMVTTGAYTPQERNEIVYGTTGADTINAAGLNARYIMYGGDGNDTLRGGEQMDVLYGGAGNDTMTVSDSGDQLFGDADNDHLIALGTASSNVLNGGFGNDVIDLGYNSGDTVHHNTAYGDAGSDTLYVRYGSDDNVLMGHDSTTGTAGDTSTDTDYLYAMNNVIFNTLSGGGGNDYLWLGYYVGDAVHQNFAYGDAGTDYLYVKGDSQDNVLMGHDSTSGTAGDTSTDADYLYAVNNVFNNIVRGGGGNDTIYLGANSDDAVHDNTAYGDAGADSLLVQYVSHDNVLMGHDSTTGTAGDTSTDADYVYAANNASFNTLSGGGGNDLLLARDAASHNVLNGNDGSDTLRLYQTASLNTLSGGAGNDGFTLGMLSGDAVHHNTVYGDGGADTLKVQYDSHDNVLMGHDSTTGTAGDTSTDAEFLYAYNAAYNNTLSGGGGNDNLWLGYYSTDAVYNNTAYGDAGSDTLYVKGDSHDNVLMGHNSTTGTAGDTSTDTDYFFAFQTAHTNTLRGGGGIDSLWLGYLSDDAVHHNTAYGDAGGDSLYVKGDSHDNVLRGHDSTTGTAGDTSTDADSFYGFGTANNNTLSGGGGNDSIFLGASFGDAVHHNTAYGDAGADTLAAQYDSHDNVLMGHNSTTGTAGDTSTDADYIYAANNANLNTLSGGGGNDLLLARDTAVSNVLNGNDGADTLRLYQTASLNTLSGGAGNDELDLGLLLGDAVHHNTAFGDGGADTLKVQYSSHDNVLMGHDSATGTAGDTSTDTDLFYAYNTVYNNTLSGGGGNDYLWLGYYSSDAVHHNTAYGDAGTDTLYVKGDSHDNVLMGHDSSTGTAGDTSTNADSFFAFHTAYNNTLSGGGGNDTLWLGYTPGDAVHHNTAHGDAGLDALYVRYSSHENLLDAGAGNDILFAANTANNNILRGGDGNDEIRLGANAGDAVHHNTAYGDAGADFLYVQYNSHDNVLMGHDSTTGTVGDTSTDGDTLQVSGNATNNTLNGGGGDDNLYASDTAFNNSLRGYIGNDYLHLGINSGDAVHHNTAFGGAGSDTLLVDFDSHDNLLMGHDGSTGTPADTSTDADSLYAYDNASFNVLHGGGGPDVIVGNSMSNTLVGDTGADSITGGSGSEVNYHGRIDQLSNPDGSVDTVVSGGGDDTVYVSVVDPDVGNNSPTLTTPISDVTVNEDAANTVFSLHPNFADIEDSDAALTFTVVSNSNPALFSSVDISDPTNFTLDYASNANGAADITIRATDTGGLYVEDTFHLTVNAVNDEPSATSQSLSVNEDEVLQITLSGNDGDPETQNLTYFLFSQPAMGALYASAADANNYQGALTPGQLAGPTVFFRGDPDFNGPTAFNFQVKDDGGTANGGVDTSVPNGVSIQVIAVNDAPVNTVGASSIRFEGTLTFNGTLSVFDSDAGSDDLNVTLSTSHGNLTLGPTVPGGLSVTGNNSHTVTLEGSQSEINTALDGLTYTPDSGAVIYAGTDTISVVTSDLGHNPSGVMTDTDPINLNVNLRNVNGVDYWVVNMVSTGSYTPQERNELVIGTSGDDTINASGLNSRYILYGNDGNDTLTGGNNQDVLYGGAGNDDLYVSDSGDQLFGEADMDRLYAIGTASYNTLSGGIGDDSIYLGYNVGDAVHHNTAYGDAGSDGLSVFWDSHDNVLMGHDSTTGTAGDTSTDADILEARDNANHNILSGGGGYDVLRLRQTSSYNVLSGGAGDDIVVLGVSASADAVHHNTAYGDAGSDSLYVQSDSHENLLMGHDSTTGTAGDTSADADSFYAKNTAHGNTLSGGGGNDFLNAYDTTSYNVLSGGAGEDQVTLGYNSGDAVHHNTAYGDAGTDLLDIREDSHDNVVMGHDSTTGTVGDTSTDPDHIYVYHVANHNTLNGGGGSDVIRAYNAASYNVLSGGADSDQLYVGVVAGDTLHNNTAYGDAADDQLYVQFNSFENVLMGHDSTTGTAGDTSNDADSVYALNNANINWLSGGGGNDEIYLGLDFGDAVYLNTAYGDAGDDTIKVQWDSHDNVLMGHDSTTGTAGDWSLDADTLIASGNAHTNRLSGGGGSDVIVGNSMSNTLVGDTGADSITGGTGSEVIYHGRSDQFSIPDGSVDTIVGGGGADIIYASTVDPDVANNSPTVTTPISDVTVNEDAANTVFSVYPNFADVENTDAQLTYTVVSNTSPGLFSSVNISDPTNFTLDYAPNAHGEADITIRATDTGGLYVEDTFHVTVNHVNDFDNAFALTAGPTTQGVAIADVNNDGRLDILMGVYNGQSVLYLNNGNLSFTPVPVGPSNGATYSVALGDVNGDNRVDMVFGNVGTNSVIYLNNGGLNPTFNTVVLPSVHTTYSVAIGDLNGDNRIDILQGNADAQSVMWLNNNNVSWTGFLVGPSSGTFEVAVGQVAGDARQDIVFGVFGGTSYIYQNVNSPLPPAPGVPQFTAIPLVSAQTYSVAIADVNGSGFGDVAIGNWQQQSSLYADGPSGNGIYFNTSAWQTTGIRFADINMDGLLDIVTSNAGQQSFVYLNNGNFSFTAMPIGSSAQFTCLAVGDVTGDGLPDVVFGGISGSPTIIYYDV